MFKSLPLREFIKTASLAALSMAIPAEVFASPAETVIYGNFYTVDAKKPKAQAVAISDGIFIYVGDESGVKSHVDKGTKVLKYKRGVILPGLIDGHALGHAD